MIYKLIAAALSLLALGRAALAEQLAPRPLQPQAMLLRVSDQGTVSEVRYLTEAPAAVRDLVTQVVASWKFSPKLIDGKPVPWATQLNLWLLAEPLDNGSFRLKVDRVQTQNLRVQRSGYPDLPVSAARSFRKATVCADLAFDETTGELQIAALWVDEKPVGPDNSYMRSVRESLPRWKIEPLQLDGQTYRSGSVRVSMDYSATGGDLTSGLFALKCLTKPGTDVGSFRLLSPVVGSYLVAPQSKGD